MTVRRKYTLGPGTYTNFAATFSNTDVILTGNITFVGDTAIYASGGSVDASTANITFSQLNGKLAIGSGTGPVTLGNITATEGGSEVILYSIYIDYTNGSIRASNTGSYTNPLITANRVSFYGYGPSGTTFQSYRPITINAANLSVNVPSQLVLRGSDALGQIVYRALGNNSGYPPSTAVVVPQGYPVPNQILLSGTDAAARFGLVPRTQTISGGMYMSAINAEFGLGNRIGAYRGTTWFKDDGSSGTFPSAPIKFSDFFDKRVAPPYYDVLSSTTITLPQAISGTLGILVIAGGGGGGGEVGNGSATLEGGGGGGAGGIIWRNFDVAALPGGKLYITIGAGGPGSYFNNPLYGTGQNTTVAYDSAAGSRQLTLTAYGGGYGAMGYPDQLSAGGGGSGGGGSPWYGAALQGSGIAGQGNSGGFGQEDSSGGGGGGYSNVGGSINGGAGAIWGYNGFSISAGGGGGSAGDYRVTGEGSGGSGGGGRGGIFRNGDPGTDYTGGGGGGAWGGTGGNGGRGRVIIWTRQ